ncbi:MAG: hypothetical protein HQL69_20205 [Magnetococcales bacterium]|nr:hypothetical protein [Magnetococcales bacterium]
MASNKDSQNIHETALRLAMSATSVEQTAAAGLLLVGSDRFVHSKNSLSEAIIAQDDGLILNGDGVLSIWNSTEDEEFGRLLYKISCLGHNPYKVGAMAISRPSGLRAYSIMMHRYFASNGHQPTNKIIIAIHDHEIKRTASRKLLIKLFGLTQSEAEVLALLVETGRPIPEIAKSRDVSVHTVKSQVDKIRQKVKADSQMDLLRIVMSTPGVFNMPNLSLDEQNPWVY